MGEMMERIARANQAEQFDFMRRSNDDLLKGVERRGVLSALFDAAHLADAIGRDLEKEHSRGLRVTKAAADKRAVAKRIGDAIWEIHQEFAHGIVAIDTLLTEGGRTGEGG